MPRPPRRALLACSALALAAACQSDAAGDDDSAAPPEAEAPELSGLALSPETGTFGSGCKLIVAFDVHDAQGDLHGGSVSFSFQGSGIGGTADFSGALDEQEDAVDASLRYGFDVGDGADLPAGKDYDDLAIVLVDAAGNASGELRSGAFTTPDTSCAM
ncbi:hypothetical protein L6R50_11720 [Myxococcota bacterium]|nr:hypothetical protein [Myxococcota bacterium]